MYSTCKRDSATEPYAAYINRKYRAALARFRCGVPLLNIEFGRYRNIPEDQRKCIRCEDVENESHVLLHCQLYRDIQAELFYHIKQVVPDFETFDDTTKVGTILANEHVVKYAARACYDIMERRRQYLEE